MEHAAESVPAQNAAGSTSPLGRGGMLVAFRRLGPARLLFLGAAAVALLGFFAYLLFRVAEPDYALLYAGIELEDGAEITGRLDAQNIPYRLRDDGATILVPAADALRLRMSLAEEGLPRGGSVGYEIFDELSAFGTTNFLADVNLRRALEGELARTISSLNDVRAARVHLVMPKRELFRRERIEPSASVTLRIARGGRPAARQVLAIQHLVAAAVPGLAPERITLVDDRGNLLARGGDIDPEGFAAGDSEEFRAAYEARLKQTIEDLLARSLGPDRVRAQVNAEMDFDRVTTTEELYDPDGQVVRSTQSVEEETTASERDLDEGVSVANNLPNTGADAAAARTSSEDTTRSEETVNYEISRTVRNHTQVGGRVRRLSVAVLVDGRMVPDATGETVYTELGQQELQQIETLVRSAVGFDESRGDVVEVINMPFNLPLPAEIEEPWLAIDKQDLWRLAELLVLVLLALALVLFVMRPAVRQVLTAAQAAPMLAGAGAAQGAVGQLAPPSGADASRGAGSERSPQAALSGPGRAEPERQIDLDRVQGGVSADLIRRATEAVDRSPDEVASILRAWLHEE